MDRVWVVTTGEYSDYEIHSIWSTEERAKQIVKILDRDKYMHPRYFECEIDKPMPERAGWEVLIDFKTGELVENPRLWDKNPQPCVLESPFVNFYDSEKTLITAEHLTVEQALKSARDFRMKHLALKEGI